MSKTFSPHNNSTLMQIEARQKLQALFKNRPFNNEELLTNLQLYTRASALAKVFFWHEVYLLIKNIPGDIYVFGVWLGQDLVLLESLRAILEPYNSSRTLVGFDTFEGYTSLSSSDSESEVIRPNGYSAPKDYVDYLHQLLDYHKEENCMGHATKFDLIKGNASHTTKQYVDQHPESLVALAYFDMALYEPTKAALQAIDGRLIPGSVVIFDELNDPRYPGETKAFLDWIENKKIKLMRSQYLPDRSFAVIQ